MINDLLPSGSGRRQAARWLKQKLSYIRNEIRPDRSTHIFVACFQKSGSTYLTNLLSDITGFPSRAMVAAYGHCEQDVHEYALREWTYRSSVTQQHAKGTYENIEALKKFKIRPVVQVRNIFDVTVSLYDHIERGRNRVPTGYVHEEYKDMTEDEKLLYLIRVHLPWYFNFLISWREASQEIDTLWISYEQLFADQVATVSRILEFYDLPVDRQSIRAAIEETAKKKSANRFNVGTAGRGQSLSDMHKDAIRELAAVWHTDSADMELIGIR
jgi:hypothetical protein